MSTRVALLAALTACADPPSVRPGPSTVDTDAPSVVDTAAPPSTAVVPLYDGATALEPETVFDRGDAIVTRFADRARDRHAREDQFQSYEHYLPFYWEYRTVRVQLVDRVAKGGGTIDVSLVTEWRLSIPEFRAWYTGLGTVASYAGNYAGGFVEEGPGTYDLDHVEVSTEGTQYRYTYTIESAQPYEQGVVPLAVGQYMEMEISQFLQDVPRGRNNYYGTVLLYEVGRGGLVPWYSDPAQRENSRPVDVDAWLGGRTTAHHAYSGEPDNDFMQMATNISGENGQPFVRGRRVHHTDMLDGGHDESEENGVFGDLVGLAGPRYAQRSCDGCHTRNGRASVADPGVLLDRWVVKVGADDGGPDPDIGSVLQPIGVAGPGEGTPTIARWIEQDGLRRPEIVIDGASPARFSARLAPQLVGMGLLDAVTEAEVLEREDPDDADGDGISGRAQVVADPATGELRLGRFGWKAGTSSLRHQIAAALNTDMGVTTSLIPAPDCGADQTGCGPEGVELADEHLDDLVKYVALLGIRPQRDHDDAEVRRGAELFGSIGCEACHRDTLVTTAHHPLAELRGQVIHPYTDLLLHDMGEDLADSLGEGEAAGAEWRTPPLWGIGLGACVTGGVVGAPQSQVCEPDASYLHDGRARDLTEAVRWHGGEGAGSREAFEALDDGDRAAVLRFLGTL